jgi:metallo-beta-lactamase family protein
LRKDSLLRVQFLGANQQVTGSCYFLETEDNRLLIDCGLYQERAFLERNWAAFPVPPKTIDCLLLTHAHLDHSGLIPKFVREGFSGKIIATSATAELLPIVLCDAARIQEEDAAYKKKRHKKEGRRGPYPEIPLYTEAEVEEALKLVTRATYEKTISLGRNVLVRFCDAGHILGSSMIELTIKEKKRHLKIIFSGDIGQWNRPLVRDPSVFKRADTVIMESTYGDRDHEDPADEETMLADIINETARAMGNVVIPVFAVERAQELLFHLSRLVREKRIPHLPVFLDSPMATDVTEVFLHHPECLDGETLSLFRSGQSPFMFSGLKFTRRQKESKAINSFRGSCLIMAGSGMCTGGRIKHHLLQNISRPESTILFVGYQAEGTLGRQILEGRPQVRIFGQQHLVRAKVRQIQAFSGHADRSDLLKWLGNFTIPHPHVFLTHGEKDVSLSLKKLIARRKGWDVAVPAYKDTWDLSSQST